MAEPVVALSTQDELRRFVRTTLCEQDALDVERTPFFETPILRGGQQWGTVFHVEGPRMLKTSAIWSEPDDRIVFYNSTGLRVRVVKLSESVEGSPSHLQPPRVFG